MKAWRILLLIVALFASATAEWSKIDCSDKDAVKAIYVCLLRSNHGLGG